LQQVDYSPPSLEATANQQTNHKMLLLHFTFQISVSTTNQKSQTAENRNMFSQIIPTVSGNPQSDFSDIVV